MRAIETIQVQGLVAKIYQDPDPQNPEEMTDSPVWLAHYHRQFWRDPKELPFHSGPEFVAWYREYKGEQPEEVDEHECGGCLSSRAEALQEQWEVFIVRAYIHGGVSLALEGSVAHARMPDQQWDVSRCGVVLINKKKWREGIPAGGQVVAEDAAYWRQVAEAHVEEWNQYLDGEVYGYRVVKMQTCNLGHEHEEELDSCWGVYGKDATVEMAREAAEALAAKENACPVESSPALP